MEYIIAFSIVLIIVALTALALDALTVLKRRTEMPEATALVISCLIWATCVIMNVITVYFVIIAK